MALRHEELRTWTQVLAIAAEEIMSLRREVWPEYRRHFLDITKSLFEEALSDLDISYEHDSKEKLNKFDKLEYYHLIQDSLATDLATGWTHRGPHRDDFSMWLGGLDARSKASQGQARLLALALRWTHAVWAERQRGEIPLFLIDDFSNELDGLRRKKLLDLLGTNSGQILMTGTDAKSVDSSSLSAYRKYEVEDGKIREVTLNGG